MLERSPQIESHQIEPPQKEWRHKEWIASLCSFVLHLLVLLGLAAWTVGVGLVGDSLTIQSGDADSSDLQEFEIATQSADIQDPQTMETEASLPSLSVTPGKSMPVVMPESALLPDAATSLELTPDLRLPLGGGSMGFADVSMDGRKRENRARLAAENGGSAESEEAVERALAYLAEHQLNNGSWSIMFSQSCNDACTPSGTRLDPYRIASTGLALLCFLGAGKTDEDEEYGPVVSKGVYYLQQNLRMTSSSGYWVGTESAARMYEHGIATLALCEAYQMHSSADLKETCQLAVNFIVESQYRDGGWDYHPGSPGDLSIAAWQVMALKSAVAAKLLVPQRTVVGIDHFLDRSRAGEFMYRYRDRKPSASMTAIGTLIQMFRGKSKEAMSIAKAIEYIAKVEPSKEDLYYNYYATQAMFHHGGPLWKTWNYKMRDYLIRTQVTQGHMTGSWWFDGDHSNGIGGRLYATCMACLILEVYYRYLPVYAAPGNDFQF